MKKRIIQLTIMFSKHALWLLISYYALFSVAMANESRGQHIRNINEVMVQVEFKDSRILDVFENVELQTGYDFVFHEKDIDPLVKIDLQKQTLTLAELLYEVSRVSSLKFKQVDQNISVYPKDIVKEVNVSINKALFQQITIRGKVTDFEGIALPGVNVVEKGTNNGTVTNLEGEYSISVSDASSATIVFSFVGYLTEEVEIAGQNTIDMTLIEDIMELDEIVVVGYGTVKKSDLTGSVASVPMEHLKNQPVRNLADMLSGRVAGMALSRTSGDIGTPSKIRVRGPNSISGSNDPLVVVDGIIGATMGPIQDVESIEVLKDASATAIYGERASNGVILVTTKKATSEKATFRVSANTGFSKRNTDYPGMMNAAEYAGFINDLNGSEVFSSAEIEEFRQNGGTDWLDEISQTGVKNDHYISYSQNLDKVSVYLSGRYTNETGTMINTSSGDNYFVRTNVGFKPTDRLKFNLDLKANKTETKNGGLSTRTSKGDPFMQALIWSPTEPMWINEEEGIYNNIDHYGALLDNPYMMAAEQNRFGISNAVYSTLNANYTIIEGLTYDVTGYASKVTGQTGRYSNDWLRPDDPEASRGSSDNFSWRLINKLNYQKSFNDAHNLNVTAVYEAEATEIWGMNATVKDMPLPDLASYYTIGISDQQSASSSYIKSSRLAYMGRLNYNFKSRYYFTASYRVDGSSGPENRKEENKFGAFPSFALSWRLSEEPFMQNNGIFDNLKLRLGWGQTGNPSGFPLTTMNSYNFDYGVGSDLLGYVPGTPANPNLKWETTTQKDIGLDVAVLGGRVSLVIDYFDKLTTDLLTLQELPSYYGYGYGSDASYLQNLGEVSNKGFEATIDIIPVKTQDFFWDVNFNFSKVKNEVLDLGDQAAFLSGTNGNGFLSVQTYRVEEGLPLGTMWGYNWTGIWQESEAEEAAVYGNVPGDYKYEDVNNDGVINLEDDGQAIGDANPDFIWGLNNTISYKNFDLSILLQGMHGQDIYNLARAAMATVHADSRSILLKDPATDYWTPQNTDSEWRNIHSTSDSKRLNSTKWIEDGSWVKVKYVGLTYRLPKDLIKFGDLALSVSAEELLTFTKYKGFDPEVSASGESDVWGGCDFGTQPIPRTFTFGVSLDF